MLTALDKQSQYILGWDAAKGSKYFCPVCHDELIIRQGAYVVWHFAHPSGSSCTSAGETMEHMLMKWTIYNKLKAMSWIKKCELEYILNDRRADIWADTSWGKMAVECQVSKMTLHELERKLCNYTNKGIHCLYVIPFRFIDTENDERRVDVWVRGLHALYLGRVYTFNPGDNRIYPVHFGSVSRYREDAYNTNGEPVGGYSENLTATKSISIGKPVSAPNIILTKTDCWMKGLEGKYLIARFPDKAFWKQDI